MEAAVSYAFKVLLRRPPTDEELRRYVTENLQPNVKSGGADAGLRGMLVSMLLSPEFLFRMEVGLGPQLPDGRRLLSPALLAYARQNHTGEAPNSLMEYTHGYRGWAAWPAYIGLGFFVRGERPTPGPFGNLSSPQTFGGWGAGSTAFWVDPERDLSFSLLTTGLMEDSRHIERVARLSDLVTASLVD